MMDIQSALEVYPTSASILDIEKKLLRSSLINASRLAKFAEKVLETGLGPLRFPQIQPMLSTFRPNNTTTGRTDLVFAILVKRIHLE